MTYFPGSNCLIKCTYFDESTVKLAEISFSKSSMYTLNSIGEMIEPWGTPAGHGAGDDNV